MSVTGKLNNACYSYCLMRSGGHVHTEAHIGTFLTQLKLVSQHNVELALAGQSMYTTASLTQLAEVPLLPKCSVLQTSGYTICLPLRVLGILIQSSQLARLQRGSSSSHTARFSIQPKPATVAVYVCAVYTVAACNLCSVCYRYTRLTAVAVQRLQLQPCQVCGCWQQ
jgi:hypothetical protein